MAIQYVEPRHWIRYEPGPILADLVNAKSLIQSLAAIPYQREWVERLQNVQLKMEIAGTSRIEGAEFANDDLERALDPHSAAEELNRSQRQAKAAAQAYRWIRTIPGDRPLSADLVKDVHRLVVIGCDDDHCEPGRLRPPDNNVTFGLPPHRGCEGGEPCHRAFENLIHAVNHDFRAHDPLLQAFAFHYHFASMHPFLDGNGRTARALEALLLQRAGLHDTAFIAMSNYYYDHKAQYLETLGAVRAQEHDLTSFIAFALRGVVEQCQNLLREARRHMQVVLYRHTAERLFGLLKSKRRRFIGQRQLKVLYLLVDSAETSFSELWDLAIPIYSELQKGEAALVRDLTELAQLGAVSTRFKGDQLFISPVYDWPAHITESTFAEKIKNLPKAVSTRFEP